MRYRFHSTDALIIHHIPVGRKYFRHILYPGSEKLPWNENAAEEAKYQAQHIHNTVDGIIRFGNHAGEKAKA